MLVPSVPRSRAGEMGSQRSRLRLLGRQAGARVSAEACAAGILDTARYFGSPWARPMGRRRGSSSRALRVELGPPPTALFCLPSGHRALPRSPWAACLSGVATKGSAPAWSRATQVRGQVCRGPPRSQRQCPEH